MVLRTYGRFPASFKVGMMTEIVGDSGREEGLRGLSTRSKSVEGLTGNFLFLLISPCNHKNPRKRPYCQPQIRRENQQFRERNP
jgi:hypothetical protein